MASTAQLLLLAIQRLNTLLASMHGAGSGGAAGSSKPVPVPPPTPVPPAPSHKPPAPAASGTSGSTAGKQASPTVDGMPVSLGTPKRGEADLYGATQGLLGAATPFMPEPFRSLYGKVTDLMGKLRHLMDMANNFKDTVSQLKAPPPPPPPRIPPVPPPLPPKWPAGMAPAPPNPRHGLTSPWPKGMTPVPPATPFPAAPPAPPSPPPPFVGPPVPPLAPPAKGPYKPQPPMSKTMLANLGLGPQPAAPAGPTDMPAFDTGGQKIPPSPRVAPSNAGDSGEHGTQGGSDDVVEALMDLSDATKANTKAIEELSRKEKSAGGSGGGKNTGGGTTGAGAGKKTMIMSGVEKSTNGAIPRQAGVEAGQVAMQVAEAFA